MSLTRKDGASTVLAVLVALAYLANARDWGIPLLTSNRWAAGAIGLLGMMMCGLGSGFEQQARWPTIALGALGVATLALLVAALWTGAQWALGLLALATLVLWAGATLRHAATGAIQSRPPHPV